MSRDRRLLVVSAAALVVLAAAGSTATAPAASPSRASSPITPAEIREHLVALQRIANRNGGNRFAGTAGYDASARYVAARMRGAGYRVRFQQFRFPFVADRSPPVLRTSGTERLRPNRDYGTLLYSGNGAVEAPVVAVDLLLPSPSANASTSGCEAADYASFPSGAVALVQRGGCFFRQKVEHAAAAGAAAAIVMNEGNPGRRGLFQATLGPPQVSIPALAASAQVGDALRNGRTAGLTGVTVTLRADVIAETRRTRNVIAESRVGNPANLVVAGAHLDSVDRGPGVNDNGSGSALVLAVAESLARSQPANRLRFVWWGGEELGLLGSRRYVSQLSPAELRRHALYLNFDMVGSKNFVPFVYKGSGETPPGSAEIERVFTRYFNARGQRFAVTDIGGASDHAAFARAGVPVGGLFSGADGDKSAAQKDAFGGQAGAPYDACYHRSCDTLANVDVALATRLARGAAFAVAHFGRDVSAVRRAR
ncbi:MAG TPA: M28 family peptidase [Gaiella sp.]|nr:M28 family peptidase [Gaiella sp.]